MARKEIHDIAKYCKVLRDVVFEKILAVLRISSYSISIFLESRSVIHAPRTQLSISELKSFTSHVPRSHIEVRKASHFGPGALVVIAAGGQDF